MDTLEDIPYNELENIPYNKSVPLLCRLILSISIFIVLFIQNNIYLTSIIFI